MSENTVPARQPIRSICVYCGSRDGARPVYRDGAAALGDALARAGVRLVYGGARVGLMGTIADAALAAGGEVYGVIPRSMIDRELAHTGLTELNVVETMHQRKLAMIEAADGFIAMPGGFGTLEELFEVLTWHQLGWHDKPCGLLDIDGFYQPLADCLTHMQTEAFLSDAQVARIQRAPDAGTLLARMGVTRDA
ncbi:TIGR00730 family Rossman fold protein [Salinisphaera sp. S4-8]|uniref:LOG family protein n=1 Tax=Salinisphaera sp. S4-8 TaxID=633357 RepID=UPI00333ECABC